MNKLKILAIKRILHQSPLIESRRSIDVLKKNIEYQVDPRIKQGDFQVIKKHPGKNVLNFIQIPSELERSINKVISDQNGVSLFDQVEAFDHLLKNRRRPTEYDEILKVKEELKKSINIEENVDVVDTRIINENLEEEINKKLKAKFHPWKPLNFTSKNSLLYLMNRFAPDYATVKQVLNEIKKRDPSFSPKHLFDFGSGVGTVMWAAYHLWNDEIVEYFNNDVSPQINLLSELITKDGVISKPSKLRGVVYKRNYPKTGEGEFELVTSAFSLLELPNRAARYQILQDLWSKVALNGYLVLIEAGYKHSFYLIEEARDFFINYLNDPKNESKGYIFSPCPHHKECPLLKINNNCKFKSSYQPLNIYDKKLNLDKREFPYSYIVFKKSDSKPEKSWPRLVYEKPKLKSGVMHATICGDDGELNHLIASRNRSKVIRSIVKYSEPGDSLPLYIGEEIENVKQ